MKTMSGTLPLAVERTRESIQVKQAILEDGHLVEDLQELADACIRALEAGGKLIFFGNGGSAADAEHLVAELTGRYLRERRALAAIEQKELITAGMTGRNGGKLSDHSLYCLNVPSEHTPRIQEAHILLGHIMCEIIEENFASGRNIS